NKFTLGGTVERNVNYDGRSGNDDVHLTSDATVSGSVRVRLGGGDNTFTHEGDIAHNLFVTSANENDTATVADTANVGGQTKLALGDQHEGWNGGGHRGFLSYFGLGRFGRGFGG